MAYEQDGYVLHKKDVELKGGRAQTIYYFCKAGNKPKSGEPCDTEIIDCRSGEHTSELQSRYVISYAVFCLDRKSVV